MSSKLHKGSRFLTDYAEIVLGLSAANREAAKRFCDAVERALALRRTQPQLGSRTGFRGAPTVRKWMIQRFPNYLLSNYPLSCEAREATVVVIRFLHGACNLPPEISPN